ncbi:GNAT family N-acetyltransferase [Methylomicrobium sp. RS1]|uniref:GNAT family N-acetyltransferase n=1 Tax=Candidatus Methylomicrobium oryzae TaxID=2802053 RepID=UPI00192463C9|nr:GNAT family N-acetyltransferase [Methylomicrobium sp. RS1]MBL1263311.1 GNAT family N-acetyltransferase [Methylomicrobium sp. RS1]
MNIPDYRIEPADFQADSEDLRAVRNTVFVDEQHIPPEIEWDELDPHSVHLIARDSRHTPIGTGRLTPERKIGRMAVLSAWRGQGVGKSLMAALLSEAQKRDWPEVSLNAQVPVVGFYEQFGFVREGEIFIEAGIPHQAMRLKLQPATAAERRTVHSGRSSVPAVEFATLESAIAATLEIIAGARRSLGVFTPNLELPLYGHPDIAAALRQFAIRSRDGCARIIIQDTARLRGQPHPVLELAQKLPSSFQFRTPSEPEDQQYASAYLFNDREGYLFRLFGDRYAGVWSSSLSGRNRQLAEEFERCWQRSQPCTEFRLLSI